MIIMKRIETTFPNEFRENPIPGDTTRPSLIGLKRTQDGILTREACRRCKKEMWRYKHLTLTRREQKIKEGIIGSKRSVR